MVAYRIIVFLQLLFFDKLFYFFTFSFSMIKVLNAKFIQIRYRLVSMTTIIARAMIPGAGEEIMDIKSFGLSTFQGSKDN